MLYSISIIVGIVSSLICLNVGVIFKQIIKRYRINHGYTNAVYHKDNGYYEFKDDFGVNNKIKKTRNEDSSESILDDENEINCFICYDRRDYNIIYECSEDEEEDTINYLQRKKKKTFIISCILLVLSSIGMAISPMIG